MSVIKDIQLNGSNLCNVECMDKNATLHPETCTDQVITTHAGNITLTEWLSNNETDPEQPYGGFADYNSMHSWLEENYPINAETITLPIATTSTLGAIKVGQYLSINNTGVLSVDKEALNIPEIPDINIATTSGAGIVKLGSNTSIPVALNGSDYQTTSEGKIFPLKLDSNSRAGIFIPNAYHKVNWSEIEDANNYVKNNTLTINYDGQAYEFTSNGSTDTSINISSISYNAGEGIDIDNGSIKQSAATNSSLGGIRVGYTETNNKRAVQLDPTTNQAFVELSTSVATWISNGLSRHYFNVTKTGYVPIMRIARAAGYTDGFKINQLFRLVSRHGAHFIGEFYIDFKNVSGLAGVIMARDIVSAKKDNVDFLTKNDIYVVKGTPTEEEYEAGLTANDIAVIYFNVKKLVAETSSTARCVFIVDILGCNDVDSANNKMVNNYTYYCTTNFGDDIVISSSDILSDLTGLTSWNFTTLPTA